MSTWPTHQKIWGKHDVCCTKFSTVNTQFWTSRLLCMTLSGPVSQWAGSSKQTCKQLIRCRVVVSAREDLWTKCYSTTQEGRWIWRSYPDLRSSPASFYPLLPSLRMLRGKWMWEGMVSGKITLGRLFTEEDRLVSLLYCKPILFSLFPSLLPSLLTSLPSFFPSFLPPPHLPLIYHLIYSANIY